MTHFDHPALGTLTLSYEAWRGTVRVPYFSQFTLGVESDLAELEIVGRYEDESPDIALLDFTVEAISTAHELVPKALGALLDDLHGRSGRDNMWWYNDIATVCERLDCDSIETVEDLFPFLRFPLLYVGEFREPGKPCVELSFDSLIDSEHGVGILTDGQKIMKIGYARDF